MGKRGLILVSGHLDQEMQLVAADTLIRMRRLAGHEANIYAPGVNSEMGRLFGLVKPQSGEQGLRAYLIKTIQNLMALGGVTERQEQGWKCLECGYMCPEPGRCAKCASALTKETLQSLILEGRYLGSVRARLTENSLSMVPKARSGEFLPPAQDAAVCLGWAAGEEIQPAAWLQEFLGAYFEAGLCQENSSSTARVLFVDRDTLLTRLFDFLGFLEAAMLPWPEGFACHTPPQFVDNRSREVSPLLLAKNYGGQSLRYVLLSTRASSGDPPMTEEQLVHRLNQHLSNELGNLVSRTMSMVSRYSDDLIPPPEVLTRQYQDLDLRGLALQAPERVLEFIEQQEFHQAISLIWRLVARANKFLEETSPWQMAGNAVQAPRLNTVLYTVTETLRFIGVLLLPLLPETGESILNQLGLGKAHDLKIWPSLKQWGLLPPRTKIVPGGPLFPRIHKGRPSEEDGHEQILREELARIQLIVARIVSADQLADNDGVLQLVVYDGSQRRRVLASLARDYKPQALTGKKVVLVANLRPVENQGLVSEGEVLTAQDDEGRAYLLFVDDNVPEGSPIQCLN